MNTENTPERQYIALQEKACTHIASENDGYIVNEFSQAEPGKIWTKETRAAVLDKLGIAQHANGSFSKDGRLLSISFTPDGRVLARNISQYHFKEIYRHPVGV